MQGYLHAIKEKSEWWVQELQNRVKHKVDSLKKINESLAKEQRKTETLKKETEETAKLTQEVQVEVNYVYSVLMI